MKSLAILVILTALVYVSANILPPVYDGPTYELTMIEESKTNDDDDDGVQNLAPIRHRRVTCDLLSFQSKWFSFNDSACAAKCLAQRRRGGRCSDGICVCRS